jgi:glycosyltransferase involved in cell wall biosynthesis
VKKAVLITNIPNPYRVPLFNELAAQLKEHNWSLTVIFGSRGYSRRRFELNESDRAFHAIFLDSASYQVGSDNEKTTFSYKGLTKAIRNEKPDVIITNGFSPATLRVWLQSFIYPVPFLIWSGAVNAPGRFDSAIRKLQRKLMVNKAAGFIVYGSKAADYLKSLGSGSKPVYTAINTVDTEFFASETTRHRTTKIQDGKFHLTFTGYLVKRKKVENLLSCIALLSQKRNDFVLDILGDGEDRKRLENWCTEHQLNGVVKFHGFIQKEDLPKHLALSVGFLFQTDFDIWGLVLNEAMAAGLPVIASPHAGAAADLIRDGVNGYISDFSDTTATIARIEELLDNRDKAQEMGRNAAAYIQQHAGLRQSASGFVSAILKA